ENVAQSDCLYGSGGLEAFVYEPYRDGAFPGGGRGALDRAAADVSEGEDRGPAGLQDQRRAALVGEWGCGDVAAGEQEAVAVLGELAGQPLGSGLGADEDEQPADGQVRLRLLARPADPHALQLIGPDQPGDLRVWRDDDAGLALDPVHQVTRHRRVKRVSPDDH